MLGTKRNCGNHHEVRHKFCIRFVFISSASLFSFTPHLFPAPKSHSRWSLHGERLHPLQSIAMLFIATIEVNLAVDIPRAVVALKSSGCSRSANPPKRAPRSSQSFHRYPSSTASTQSPGLLARHIPNPDLTSLLDPLDPAGPADVTA
jgi:hypothetical protein